MKLVIDIDDETYNSVIADGTVYVLDEILVENAIYNGIPLDDIRQEIMAIGKWRFDYEIPNPDMREVIKIIDKYNAESEE